MRTLNKHAVVIAIIALVLAAGLGVYVTVLTDQFNDTKKEQIISNTQSYYATSKLEFCLNKTIAPCDDVAITDWNTAHPEDTFKLKSFQELVEEGIEQYSNSRK